MGKQFVVIIPRSWKANRLRWVIADVAEPMIVDIDDIPTPLETTDSLYDYGFNSAKRLYPAVPRFGLQPEDTIRNCSPSSAEESPQRLSKMVDGAGKYRAYYNPNRLTTGRIQWQPEELGLYPEPPQLPGL